MRKWKKVNGIRLTYQYELNGLPAYNFKRFGKYTAPFISCGDRHKDRIEYDRWLWEEHGLTRKVVGDVVLHHQIDGTMMLVPKEIHRVRHIGFIGVMKHLNP